MTVHLELVRFYYDFVRNFDASEVAKFGVVEETSAVTKTDAVSGEPEL